MNSQIRTKALARLGLFFLWASTLVGCSSPGGLVSTIPRDSVDQNIESLQDLDSTDAQDLDSTHLLVNGVPTFEQPAVGILKGRFSGGCSGTLITRWTVLTAAHCIDYRNWDVNQSGTYPHNFHIYRTNGQEREYPVVAARSRISSGQGAYDVAVVLLAYPVSSFDAQPVALKRSAPPAGTPVVTYGNGPCNGQPGVVKQKIEFNFLMFAPRGCRGDSGGATMTKFPEAIFSVHSYIRDRDQQLFVADVPANINWIYSASHQLSGEVPLSWN